ncbi:threonine/serine exporter family protein [Psychrobacillus vulpis]|uniref:Threonine/serine exporter n=1 Tax=Psychrobacillus vulpis TaxID=2325572 RepID=A0A544TSI6_9BACI|nr:threonine/serine exporter family protein [Psychrobacillus vulpis]TQR20407.1 threonine/serine exporter [Psychrobacillus vulpis]
MSYLFQGILSFAAAASFGILFNAPKKSLLSCGLVGMTGWLIYAVVDQLSNDPVEASFAGAFTIAFVAHIMARHYRMPVIIFSVAGIIPLVPGGSAYNAMRNIVEKDYNVAMEYGSLAFMISGSIAMGLVFAEIITQLYLKVMGRLKLKP